MARKNKGNVKSPNAPRSEPLFTQPPLNPYYFDSTATESHPLRPPPYSDLTVPIQTSLHNQSVPMAQVPTSQSNPHRYVEYPRQQSTVVIPPTQITIPYNSRAEKYHRRVRSFNNNTLLTAILAVVLSLWAYKMYDDRKTRCLFDFTVVKPNKDVKISIGDVRDMHLEVAYGSGFIIFLCLIRIAIGQSKSYSCYMFLIGLCSFIATLYTASLAYLAFYSPCALRTNEIITNLGKTVMGQFSDSLPSPDKGIFGEANVFMVAEDDKEGVVIFIFDMFNFVFFLTTFITSTLLC